MSYEAEQFDKDLIALVHTCLEHRITSDDPFTAIGEFQNWAHRVQEAARVMEVWIEESDRDDPRANGWVGQDGRP